MKTILVCLQGIIKKAIKISYGSGRRQGGGGRRGGGFGLGAGGSCVCPVCGIRVAHMRGLPCYQTPCPKCGSLMIRDAIYGETPKQSNLDRTIQRQDISVGLAKPHVDLTKCKGCSLCVNSCPFHVIRMVNGKAFIDQSTCRGCGVCISSCPEGAIIH
ncbi:MAG: 4Fe-4S binding protein [Candidatus Heimdallarchaeaceae archaeon]